MPSSPAWLLPANGTSFMAWDVKFIREFICMRAYDVHVEENLTFNNVKCFEMKSFLLKWAALHVVKLKVLQSCKICCSLLSCLVNVVNESRLKVSSSPLQSPFCIQPAEEKCRVWYVNWPNCTLFVYITDKNLFNWLLHIEPFDRAKNSSASSYCRFVYWNSNKSILTSFRVLYAICLINSPTCALECRSTSKPLFFTVVVFLFYATFADNVSTWIYSRML